MERSANVAALLERVAARQHSSAAILWASGSHKEAMRAEVYAARIRLSLDEPEATDRMVALAQEVYTAPNPVALYERALDGAVRLLRADFGNVQISDPASGALRIAAQHGFGSEFLDYFSVVEVNELACGRAAGRGTQAVVADIRTDPAFAPHRDVLRESGFRSVQSTPLIDLNGRVRGVMSTHFLLAGAPSARDLLLVHWFAEHVAAAMAQEQSGQPTAYGALVAMHERAARSHDGTATRHERTANVFFADGEEQAGAEKWARARNARERAVRERERAHALMALQTFA